MQTPPIDLDTKKFFEPDIAQANLVPEVIQECELAGLIWSFEYNRFKTESLDESIRKSRVQLAAIIE
jgi:hypothetical protein